MFVPRGSRPGTARTVNLFVMQHSDFTKRGEGSVRITRWREYFRFSQGDSNWKDSLYGGGTGSIGTWGCAMTCVAMVLKAWGVETNPLEFNRWMRENGGVNGSKE